MSSSTHGPFRPSSKTYNLLYAKSSNWCAFPGCPNPITVGETLVGNVCHIKAASPEGPRYDPNQTNEDRHGYENLVLMCSIHNKVVDSDVTTYTVERLNQMKVDHESKCNSISSEEVEHAVQLLVSVDGTAGSQTRDINVTANNPQNSVVAGVYQNIVNNYVSQLSSHTVASQNPCFVFVFGVPLGDNNSANWMMLLKHFGPGPAHNCTIDFYDKDRINVRREWSLKHSGADAPPGLVGEFRYQFNVPETGADTPPQSFRWTPLDPDRQHYSVNISSRDGGFAESWEITRVDGQLRAKVRIERGPAWVERNPKSDPLILELVDTGFISTPLLAEVPRFSAPNVHPGWKPNHRFEAPIAIIDPNGNLQVMSGIRNPDGSTSSDFGAWNILTRHYGDTK